MRLMQTMMKQRSAVNVNSFKGRPALSPDFVIAIFMSVPP